MSDHPAIRLKRIHDAVDRSEPIVRDYVAELEKKLDFCDQYVQSLVGTKYELKRQIEEMQANEQRAVSGESRGA